MRETKQYLTPIRKSYTSRNNLDLEGNSRSLNIEQAFKNLNFDRKGTVVQETLISRPIIIASGED